MNNQISDPNQPPHTEPLPLPTKTPRTDAEKEGHPYGNCVSINFARALESELAEACGNLTRWKAVAEALHDCVVHDPSCNAAPQSERMSSRCTCGLREVAIEFDNLKGEK